MMETIVNEVLQNAPEWTTAKPWPEQDEVSHQSQWKSYENYRV